MAREYFSTVGSGQVPFLQDSPLLTVPDVTYPVPSPRDDKTVLEGEGVVVLNWSDCSAWLGLDGRAVAVASSAVSFTPSPLNNRRALVIHNNGPDILFIGPVGVTTSDGLPLAVGEKIAISLKGLPNVEIYGVSAGTSDARVMEVA